VEVQAASGTPLAGQVVNWTVVSGGGVVSAPTSVTDSNGIASVTWVLGPVTGADSLNAGVNGTSLSVNLSATAIAP
jgi:hypothetical protein